MTRILLAAGIVCLGLIPHRLLFADSSAITVVSAGNAESPGGHDADMGVLASASSAADTDPEFGTASADATVTGPSLRVFGFAASFQGPAWAANGEADWSDFLNVSFPVSSLVGTLGEVEVEFVASFTWDIAANGDYKINMLNRRASYSTATGEISDDFGTVPEGASGSAVVTASVPFDQIDIDPLDPSMYRGEVFLSMMLNAGASSGDHLHGSFPIASGEIELKLINLFVNGVNADPLIVAESGLNYGFDATTADFDDDGDVDGRDFMIWQRGFGMTTGAEPGDGDSNADGDVDGDDLGVWQSQYGQPGHLAETVYVPEPGGAVLAGSTLLIGLARRKRRG